MKRQIVRSLKLNALMVSLAAIALMVAACGGAEEEAPVAAVAPASTVASAPASSSAPAPAADTGIGKHLIGELEGPTIVTDHSQYPTSFSEAPQLAALVKSGDLPPVEERISRSPLVIEPLDEIGKYGGIIRRANTGPADFSNGIRMAGNDKLLHWDYTGSNMIPQVAEAWEVSADGRETTFHLREGMKWDDGMPFTADDFMFWYEDIFLNEEITPAKSPYFRTDRGPGKLVKIDDTTIKFVFPDPYFAWQIVVTGPTGFGGQAHDSKSGDGGGYGPAHYLKQYLPKYGGGEDAVNKLAVAEGYSNWVEMFIFKRHWAFNPDLPSISAWSTKIPITERVWVLERNPYFWAVDTAGNQLPYIDEIHFTVAENLEVLNLRAIAGELDFQARHLDLQKIPVFLANQEKGDYSLYLDPGGIGADAALFVNPNYAIDPVIGKLLDTTDFRRALSLGIDRDQLNETFWLGLGTPGSIAPAEGTPYNPGPEWRTTWSTLDIAKSNELLDGIGLTEKDSEGYRLRPDGSGDRLIIDFQTYVGFMNFTDMGEMMKEDWEEIGIFMNVQELERGLNYTKIRGQEHQIAVDIQWGSENMFAHGFCCMPSSGTSSTGGQYGLWFQTQGAEGLEPPAEMQRAKKIWTEAFGATLDPVSRTGEHYDKGKEVWKILIDEQYVIGTVGIAPGVGGLRIVKNDLGNIPSGIFNGSSTLQPLQARPDTFYWKK